jgi:hypothetical protein
MPQRIGLPFSQSLASWGVEARQVRQQELSGCDNRSERERLAHASVVVVVVLPGSCSKVSYCRSLRSDPAKNPQNFSEGVATAHVCFCIGSEQPPPGNSVGVWRMCFRLGVWMRCPSVLVHVKTLLVCCHSVIGNSVLDTQASATSGSKPCLLQPLRCSTTVFWPLVVHEFRFWQPLC